MSENRLLYGFDETLPLTHTLRAGPFSVLYENGALRYIKYGENEIIRIIYISLRDKNWGTHVPIIHNQKIISSEKSFMIEYDCRYEENGKTIFTWNAKITGDEKGKIVFSAHGETINDLLKNRSGFCVLHPIKNTSGESLVVTHSDMSKEKISFPKAIAPFVPATDITKLRWTNNAHEYVIEMKGEVFEMEDHRNWTDTSFKSYCTPLSIPFPVQLNKGDTIDQQIIFYPLDDLAAAHEGVNTEIKLSVDEATEHIFPLIGTDASTDISSLSKKTILELRKIKFDYYTIEVNPEDNNWQDSFSKAIEVLRQLEFDLFVKLKLGDEFESEFTAFTDVVVKNKIDVKYLLLVSRDHHFTSQPAIDWAEKEIKKIFPAVHLGIGTETNFTELNRNRKEARNIDFVSYAIHPQEHAFDNLSLIENVESQSDTVQTAKIIYPNKKIFISPVTLRRRINPYAYHAKDRAWSNEQKNDPRQISLWNAGWVLGSLKYLIESGASAISYFQAAGKQGIMDENGSPFPVATLLEFICRLKNATIVRTSVNDPLKCSCLLMKEKEKKYLLLANHTNDSIKIKLPFAVESFEKIKLFPSALESVKIISTNSPELSPFDVIIVST